MAGLASSLSPRRAQLAIVVLLALSSAGCGDDARPGKATRNDAGVVGLPFSGVSAELPDRPIAVATGEGAVWATSMAGGVVTKIDPKTNKPVGEKPTITGGEAPYAIDVAFGKVWVANFNSDQIVRIDPSTRKVIDRIDVDNRPFGLEDGYGYMWVTSIRRQTISRLDPRTGERVGRPIKTSGIPYQVAAGEGYIWVTNIRDGRIDKIDPRSGRLVGRPIEVGAFPGAIAVGGGYVWVANVRGGGDDDGNSSDSGASGATESPVNSPPEGNVWRLDPTTGRRVGAPIPVPLRPQAIAADDASVWVVSVDADTLVRIDAKTGRRDKLPLLVGNAPTDVAIAPAGGPPGAWVAVSKEDVAARVDLRRR